RSSEAMHIGVLTGGGDVPGLNSCIKAIVEQAAERGWSVTGFRRGWAGPLHYNPADPATHDNFLPLDPATVRIIDRRASAVSERGGAHRRTRLAGSMRRNT
ncbi:MAG: 6-phosphofructokinase, partial [Alphaproteobacteria bacterium]